MKRKLIKQGSGGYTFYVPKQWVLHRGLKAGDEIDVFEKDKKLIIQTKDHKEEIKSTEISLDLSSNTIYRSLIGGLYRGGYDEIKINFKDPKVISELQKSVHDLYGLEIFDIKKNSCIIKMIYREESVELRSHINRMVHTVKTMQSFITEDIENGKYHHEKEMYDFGTNVQKQRDFVIRTIVQQKLLDNKHFPYHTIAYNLWHIARDLYHMYLTLLKKPTKEDLDFLKKTIDFFNWTFDWKETDKIIEKNNYFDEIFESAKNYLKEKGKISGIISCCMNVMLLVQSCNSALLLIEYKNEN